MSDFVHCNSCFTLPSSSTKFNITNCSHIFCSNCSSSVEQKRLCPKCKTKCTLVPLDSSTKSEIKMYFDPIDQLLTRIAKIEKFQRFQREHLINHLKAEKSTRNSIQEKWEKKVNQLKREISLLRSQFNRSHQQLESSTSSISNRAGLPLVSPGASFHPPSSPLRAPSRSRFGQFASNRRDLVTGLRGLETPEINGRINFASRQHVPGSSAQASSRITLRTDSSTSAFR